MSKNNTIVVGRPPKQRCKIEGCERRYYGKGFCNMHYQRDRRAGQTEMCSVDECDRTAQVRGWCRRHYQNMLRHGEFERNRIAPQNPHPIGSPCTVDGCEESTDGRHGGLCIMHYERKRKTGDVGSPKRKKARKGEGSSIANGYHVVTSNGRTPLEHRQVMEEHLGRALLPQETVHHLNGQRAQNNLTNLELWSTAQPPGQRVVDKLQWAYELIELYKGTDEDIEARSRVPSSCDMG